MLIPVVFEIAYSLLRTLRSRRFTDKSEGLKATQVAYARFAAGGLSALSKSLYRIRHAEKIPELPDISIEDVSAQTAGAGGVYISLKIVDEETVLWIQVKFLKKHFIDLPLGLQNLMRSREKDPVEKIGRLEMAFPLAVVQTDTDIGQDVCLFSCFPQIPYQRAHSGMRG